MFDNRWVALSAGLFVQLVAGSAYAFGIYSNELKTTLNFTQRDVDRASSLGNIGMYGGVLAGMFYDRYKPVTGLIGHSLHQLVFIDLFITVGVCP